MDSSYLLLGEGNFSFSAVLAKRLESIHASASLKPIIFTATSYDSNEEVLQKYPEAASTLRLLTSMTDKGITVMHNIDATRPLRRQLTSLASSSSNPSTYENIIFNFPHLGIEDAQTHRSMLAHTMSCVRQSMRLNSRFFLSLANAQADRWSMREMATRNGLHLEESLPFLDAHWEGYEIKRHQSGRSFRRRVQECSVFVFRVSAPDDASFPSLPTAFQTYLREIDTRLHASPPAFVAAPCKKARTESLPSKPSKRAFIASTDGTYKEVRSNDAIQCAEKQSGLKEYACLSCGRHYATEHAVRTHVYSVHVLAATGPSTGDRHPDPSVTRNKQEGDDATSHINSSLTNSCTHSVFAAATDLGGNDTGVGRSAAVGCPHCNRQFLGGPTALAQHITDMHSGRLPLRPHWAHSPDRASADLDLGPAGWTHECAVCGVLFPSEESLAAHERGDTDIFQPKKVTGILRCPGCPLRTFVDERSLRQHNDRCLEGQYHLKMSPEKAETGGGSGSDQIV